MQSGMTDKEYTKAALTAIRNQAATSERWIIEKMADAMLLQHSQLGMAAKLNAAREKGRGGWWNKNECSIEYLRQLLREHVEKGDMMDVMNLAAMVYVREIADERNA